MIKRYSVILMLLVSVLNAEVYTVSPFSVVVKNDTKSIKDSGTINGIYFSSGTLSYLTEFTYSHTDIKYKYSTNNLVQDEFTFLYSKYFIDKFYKLGIHTNTTTDTTLQNGTTLILGVGGWKYIGYNKVSYGVDLYHSYYTNSIESPDKKDYVHISEISANASYYKAFKTFANYISLNINYEMAHSYDKVYTFFKVQDIVYYKGFSFDVSYLSGYFKTGILDGGSNVYNSQDILKEKIGISFGYNVTPVIKLKASYGRTNYDENGGSLDLNDNTFSFNVGYTIK